MKPIQDAAAIDKLVDAYHVRDRFDTQGLTFRGFQYQKGELLCSPLNPADHLLFLVEGSIQMYDLRPDGSKLPVASVDDDILIGDMEFITGRPTTFFVEAAEDCTCIALPVRMYRKELEKDVRFLHSLLDDMAEKFEHDANAGITSANLDERVLEYLRDKAVSHEITEVEALLYHLRCSRRQLQRVLKKLCDEGRLIRLGKGHYRLSSG